MLENLKISTPDRSFVLRIIYILFSAVSLTAESSELLLEPVPENLFAPIYMVVDAQTGTVLLEKLSDEQVAPASLTKLMTMRLSLQDVETGKIHRSRTYSIPPEAASDSMKPGSSVLGLTEGDEVTLATLQRAVIIASANDAAWTLAMISSGTPEKFVVRMNREALRLGMDDTRYVDPDGWSERSETTARDQIRLATAYVRDYPEMLDEIHAETEMSYLSRDSLSARPKKRNSNLLLGRVEGVDGLKTGTIPSAGFHFLATALRGETRFLVLVMGIQAEKYTDGLNRRAQDAERLLEWAFSSYFTWIPKRPAPVTVPVRHGRSRSLVLETADPIKPITLSRNGRSVVQVVDIPEFVTAPVGPGTALGTVSWYRDGKLLNETVYYSREGTERRWRIRDLFR